MKQNFFSHLTAKERLTLSFPAKLLLSKDLLVGDVLDFGCGFGKDIEMLTEKGIKITGYDKHYFPNFPISKFDTIICFYVLNVLLPEEQATVLMQVSHLLKSGGNAYFAVRRDLQFEGFRTHKVHHKPTYQCNVKLPFKSIFKNENCEIYEYKAYTLLSRIDHLDCPFCNPEFHRELITESATAYSIYDKFPVSPGHALIIPKRHSENYFNLTFREQSACWFMINYVKQILTEKFCPDGFNVGININKAAGQTVLHVHIHIIPRYSGDVINPEGGVRGVLPQMKNYKIL